MKIHIELTEAELRELVLKHVESMLGDVPVDVKEIDIQVKSKQNYKSEWESASFRAIVDKCV